MKVTLRQKELKNGNISLYLDIYENGRRKYEYLNLYLVPEVDAAAKEKNNDTLAYAQQLKSDRILHKNKVSKSTNQLTEGNVVHSFTVMDWIEHYITITDDEEEFSAATVEQTRYLLKLMKQFLSEKGHPDLNLQKFDKGWFTKFLHWLKEEYVPTKYKRTAPKPLSEGTLRNIQQRIVAVLNKAVRDGALNANPYEKLDKEETFSKPLPSHREILTPSELKLFMAQVEHSPGVIESQKAFVFACLTGLRISDIRELRWTDITINADTEFLTIVQKKTKTMNAVPICSTAKQWMPDKGKDEYVFHLPSESCVYDNIRRIAKNAGIRKDISFHTSRHTFGTLTLAATKNLYTTMRLLGHKDIRTTSIYAEVLMDDKIKAVQNTNGVFKSSKRKENKKIKKTKRTAATNTHPRKIIDTQDSTQDNG